MAWPVLVAAVVAPRSPRRILLMALDRQLRLMVITGSGVLKGRDPVETCRRAVAGGAPIVQGRPNGAEGFGRLARLAPAGTPVIGIGGVTAANAPALARAGAAGIAVIGAVWDASDPAAATRALRAAIA